jgi:hypothetical protein
LPATTPAPAVRPRASDWRTLPPTLRTRLDDLFGALAATLDSRPPVEIV